MFHTFIDFVPERNGGYRRVSIRFDSPPMFQAISFSRTQAPNVENPGLIPRNQDISELFMSGRGGSQVRNRADVSSLRIDDSTNEAFFCCGYFKHDHGASVDSNGNVICSDGGDA